VSSSFFTQTLHTHPHLQAQLDNDSIVLNIEKDCMDSPKIFLISEKTRFDLPKIDFDLKSGPKKVIHVGHCQLLHQVILSKTKPNNYLEL
jgi:hypothetical protein